MKKTKSKYFKTRQGLEITDLKQYVADWIESHDIVEIFVGCDSQEMEKELSYATCICLYENKKGAHVITKNEREPKVRAMETKLWNEVTKAIEAAEQIKDCGVKISLHLDFNSNPKFKSNQLFEAGLGYAISMGYHAEGKPNAVAASYASDRECR